MCLEIFSHVKCKNTFFPLLYFSVCEVHTAHVFMHSCCACTERTPLSVIIWVCSVAVAGNIKSSDSRSVCAFMHVHMSTMLTSIGKFALPLAVCLDMVNLCLDCRTQSGLCALVHSSCSFSLPLWFSPTAVPLPIFLSLLFSPTHPLLSPTAVIHTNTHNSQRYASTGAFRRTFTFKYTDVHFPAVRERWQYLEQLWGQVKSWLRWKTCPK